MIVKAPELHQDKIFGVGKNDADYDTSKCKIYNTWRHMIRSIYSPEKRRKNPALLFHTVCVEWLDSFITFREWYLDNVPDNLDGLVFRRKMGWYHYAAGTVEFGKRLGVPLVKNEPK